VIDAPPPYAEPPDGSLVAWGDPQTATLELAVRIDESANPADRTERWLDPMYLADDPMCWDALLRSMGDQTPHLVQREPLPSLQPDGATPAA